MKKISLVLFALLGEATNVFASYGDYSYSSSSSDGLLEFLGVLMLIWGLLEIILFFKVWGMTNDIKAIKKGYFNETDYHGVDEFMIKSLRTDLILGNTDEAKKTLLKYFVDKIESSFRSLPGTGTSITTAVSSQWSFFGQTQQSLQIFGGNVYLSTMRNPRR